MTATDHIDVDACRRTFRERTQRQDERRETLRRRALKAVRERAPAVLASYPSVRRAYAFGSVIEPHGFHPSSDVDIALEGTTAEEYFAAWRDLDRALLEWAVDVREIEPHSSFASRVRRTGVVIYEQQSAPAAD